MSLAEDPEILNMSMHPNTHWYLDRMVQRLWSHVTVCVHGTTSLACTRRQEVA
jgi:hypothetical protein